MREKKILFGALSVILLAILISPFASKYPDGLEKFAQKFGLSDKERGWNGLSSPMPNYTVPGIKNEIVAIPVAGFCGTVAVFLAIIGIAKLLKSK